MRQVAYVLCVISMVILFRWIKIPREHIYLFDVAHEVNFWTWLNVAYMLFAAQLLCLCAWLRRRAALPAVGFLLAALALMLLSMDDFMSFHEKLDPLGEALGGGSGLLRFAWVIPGSLAALVIVAVFIVAFRSATGPVRKDILTGIALFFGGALGVEMLSGAWLSEFGHRRPYTLLYHLEEALEAVGIVFVARGALRDMLHLGQAPAQPV